MAQRTQPTIILTGTPGTGKTTHGELIAAQVPELKHINVGDMVKERGLHEGWDEEWQSWTQVILSVTVLNFKNENTHR